MKINKLKAENFMKLNVEVEMEGHDVTITGKNETGKSTFINAIWYALTGKDIPAEPIQTGRESATLEVTVDRPGEQPIIVQRKFKREGKESLTVKTPDGAKYGSPQTFLNNLIGEISFNPFEFIEKQPMEQKKELQRLLGIDTAELEQRKKVALADYQSTSGLVKSLDLEIDKLPQFDSELSPRSFDEVAGMQQEITQALTRKSTWEKSIVQLESFIYGISDEITLAEARLKNNQALIEEKEKEILALKEAVPAIEGKIKRLQDDNKVHREAWEFAKKQLSEFVEPDNAKVQSLVNEITEHNKNVEIQKNRNELVSRFTQAQIKLGEHREILDSIERERVQLIQSVKMPIPGLDFADGGLTFDGLPFVKDQFSTAKMNMIGFQIAVAMNPRLKILRVKDWVLLDSESKQAVKDLAKQHEYQLFVELVTDDSDIGFRIEE